MKSVILTFPLLILLLFAACGDIEGQVSNGEGTMVAQTQTASIWTPTFIPTHDPEEPRILELLNAGFQTDGLDTLLDARYVVADATFPYIANTTFRAFRLDILCECAINHQCCTPERMFVLTMWAMKARGEKIIEQVPVNVSRMDVICFNRLGRIGSYSSEWTHVLDYLAGRIDGHMLAWRVTPNAAP